MKKLKKAHLPIVVAEASDLPLGSLGEFITADTLKPYLDAIATKATPAQITAAVSALETKILGGAGLDADTLAEINAKVGALQNLTDADKTGILNLLALCVRTADIMPVINAKADETTVANRLADKANELAVVSRLADKANESSVASRLANKADESTVANRLADKANESSVASRLADKANESSVASRLADKANESSVGSRLANKADESTVTTRLADKANETSVASRLANKADESTVVSRLADKANESSVTSRLATKADESSVATRLDAKANETSVASRLANKADESSVASRLADKANETSVASRLADKITAAQAQTIAQNVSSLLETKILGGVGTDADTLAELKAMVVTLQGLSQADLNGVMTALSTKVNKSVFDVFALTVYSKGEIDGMLEGYVANGSFEDLTGEVNIKLDKAVFDGFVRISGAEPQVDAGLGILISQDYSFDNHDIGFGTFGAFQANLLDAKVGQIRMTQEGLDLNIVYEDTIADRVADEEQDFKILMASTLNGGVVYNIDFLDFIHYLASNGNSPINQNIETKLSKAVFDGVIQILDGSVGFPLSAFVQTIPNLKIDQKTYFSGELSANELRAGSLQVANLAGSDGSGTNPNEITISYLETDNVNNPSGGDGFLKMLFVNSEQGFVNRMDVNDFLSFVATSPNSPIAQNIAGKLDKSVFDTLFNASLPTDGAELKVTKQLEFDTIQAKGIRFTDGQLYANDYNPNFINDELLPSGNSSYFLIVNDEHNSMSLSITEFCNFLTNSSNSPIAQKFAQYESRIAALEAMFEA